MVGTHSDHLCVTLEDPYYSCLKTITLTTLMRCCFSGRAGVINQLLVIPQGSNTMHFKALDKRKLLELCAFNFSRPRGRPAKSRFYMAWVSSYKLQAPNSVTQLKLI